MLLPRGAEPLRVSAKQLGTMAPAGVKPRPPEQTRRPARIPAGLVVRLDADSQRINSARRQRCRTSPASSFLFESSASMLSSNCGSAMASATKGCR